MSGSFRDLRKRSNYAAVRKHAKNIARCQLEILMATLEKVNTDEGPPASKKTPFSFKPNGRRNTVLFASETGSAIAFRRWV